MTFDGRIEAQCTVPAGTTVSATSNAGGPTAVTVPAGVYSGPSAVLVALITALNATRPITAGTWQGSLSTGASATGKVTISSSNATNIAITWTSTDLRDLLGFTANFSAVTTATGASQARGLWIPDTPLKAATDIKQAPTQTDRRAVVTPTGSVYTLVGTLRYRLAGLQWRNVAINRVWISEETTTNQSYERFFLDAIEGVGHAWFLPGSPCLISDHRGVFAGSGASLSSVTPTNPPTLDELRMSVDGWTGQWTIEWPEVVGSA